MPRVEPQVELPRATSHARWKPLRSGLLNLYKYDYEEFQFEDGHMLLRGNNGTGKSRVLALQLPFLLDGEITPSRVEPDGDPAKRFEWNLLLDKYDDRLGYTWLEFGRVDADGTEHYRTIGCGLRATRGAGITQRWYFVTRQRIGRDLFLQSEAGSALPRERLKQLVEADGGRVELTAAEFRRRIDESLFKLGESRYEALVNLLIELRKPQLSRKLEEEKLSKALSEALPPLGQSVLADVAQAFKGLEDQRNQLAAFEVAHLGAANFLVGYEKYLQAHARLRATAIRTSHTKYEAAQRQLRIAEGELETATLQLAELVDSLSGLRDDVTRAEADVTALSNSEDMKDARRLDSAAERAKNITDASERADAESQRADGAATRTDQELKREAEHVQSDLREAERIADGTVGAAKEAGLLSEHAASVGVLDLSTLDEQGSVQAARTRFETSLKRRRRALQRLDELQREVRTAREKYESAQGAADDLASRLDTKREEIKLARLEVETEVASLLAKLGEWRASVSEIAPAAPEDIAEVLEKWSERAEGDSPVLRVVRDAYTRAIEALARVEATLGAQTEECEERLAALQAEYTILDSGVHRPPPAPYTRQNDKRAERKGAPFWKMCDFRPGVAPGVGASVEAALEGAGLLDAWVLPDGRMLDPGTLDVVLVDTGEALPAHHLGELLEVRIDSEDLQCADVSEAVVARILRRIGLGPSDATTWVADDGSFGNGPLRGTWTKGAAEHIGEAARQRARRERLAALEVEIALLGAELARYKRETQQLGERRDRIRVEVDQGPTDSGIRGAVVRRDALDRESVRLRSEHVRASELATFRQKEVTVLRERRDTEAVDLGLADWVNDLRKLEQTTNAYQTVAIELWAVLRRLVDNRGRAATVKLRADQARRLSHEAAERAEQARREALKATTELATLRSMVGQAVVEVRRRLEEARARLEKVQRDRDVALERQKDLLVGHALAKKEIDQLRERLVDESKAREEGIRRLERMASERLLAIAVESLVELELPPWSATRGVEIARRIEDALKGEIDDRVRESREKQLHQGIQTLSVSLEPHGYAPSWRLDDNLMIVEAPYAGRTCTIAELRAELASEIRMREELLTAREREIIENHLIGEVATHLHELLRSAESLQQKMNEQIQSRPTSTGMTLRFVWEPLYEQVPGLAEARKRLMRASGVLSPAERDGLGTFLHEQIKRVRADQEFATWHDQLAAALDYRRWHRFHVERQQDGQWKRLTRRTHGTGSGGEKAIALTIPQFAAAAAHYSTADPLAPRLILLDEAFVGVDNDMRAKCMGLLKDFDLDFVMTSEREWACYSTLPGVAISHLTTRPGSDAVFVTRWVWNGRQRVRAERRLPPAAPAQTGFLDLFSAPPTTADTTEPDA